MTETEVFPLTSFDTDKCYGTAAWTKRRGSRSDKTEKFYTTNSIQYLGKYKKTRGRDTRERVEEFEKGEVGDSEGNQFYTIVPCTPTGGKRKYRLSRKNKKSKKKQIEKKQIEKKQIQKIK